MCVKWEKERIVREVPTTPEMVIKEKEDTT